MDWHLEPAQVLSPCPAIFGGVLSVKSPNHLPHNPASGKPGQPVLAILLTQFQQAWMYYTRFQPNIVCIWCNRTVCITIDNQYEEIKDMSYIIELISPNVYGRELFYKYSKYKKTTYITYFIYMISHYQYVYIYITCIRGSKCKSPHLSVAVSYSTYTVYKRKQHA